MKKLMIALSAVAAAIFAVGTARGDGQLFNAVDFESYTVTAFDASKTDDGASSSGDRYWFSTSNDGNVISNYTDAALSGAAVPDFFKNENVNTNYLYLDTSAPLFRTITNNTQNVSEFEGLPIGDGIYLDTLVKFTAADSAFAEDLTDGDKIAIEYVEHESEGGAGDYSYTNFVIRAGYLGSDLIQTNYFVAVPAGFNKDNWYRLTVRAISGIDGDGHVGFVVYLNGTALAYGQDVTIGDNFTATPGTIADLHTARTLYPSAVQSGDDKTTISAASFSGTGAIDDVVFTSIKPGFINEASTVTITWDTTAVSSISIAGTAVEGAEFALGTKTVSLDGTAIVVEATAAQGYDLVYTPPENGAWNSSTHQFTGLEANDICAITGFIPYFDVNGTHYGKFTDALKAAAGTTEATRGTVKLFASYTGDIDIAPIGSDDCYVTIDLAGQTLTGEKDAAIFCSSGVNLYITNSTAAIGHVVPPSNGSAIYLTGGSTTISAGSIDGEIYNDGADALVLVGGCYLEVYGATTADTFYLKTYVGSGIAVTALENSYFRVGEAPTPPIGIYQVTVTPANNATYAAAYNDGGAAIVPANDVLTVTVGKTITITATPASNYEYATTPANWAAGQDGAITIEVSAAGTVVIPEPTAKQSATWTVSITLDEHVTSVSYCLTDDLTTTNTLSATGSFTIEKNKSFVFVDVTFDDATAYELDFDATTNSITGATIAIVDNFPVITPTADASGTIVAKAKQQGGYPTYIDTTDAAEKAKYDTWATAYGADADSQYEDAFLLNCAPANVDTEKAAFKFTKIAYENGNWVTETTTKNTNGADYNGTVTVKRYSNVGCTTESATGTFFKAELK